MNCPNWKPVRFEGGRLNYETSRIINDIKEFDLDIQILYLETFNERQVKAVKYVKKNGKITNREYQKINDCSRNTASGDLADLVEKGILKPSNVKGAGSFYELK